jgi:Tfp pilus assembly protein FimT
MYYAKFSEGRTRYSGFTLVELLVVIAFMQSVLTNIDISLPPNGI